MRGILADLVGTPVKVLVDGWHAATTKAADMIVPKHLLHCQAHPAVWYNQQLRVLKQNGRRLESIWRQAPMLSNLKAAKIVSNIYLATVNATRRSYFTSRTSVA